MKNAVAAHGLPDEHYVLQIDGQVKSEHRRFVDALRAALLLKDQFPQHNVKVRATEARNLAAEVMRGVSEEGANA